jgi:Ca2+-binding EF-hand superfamily protein
MDRGGPGRHMGGHQQALSDEEIDARLRERFARLDRNSDGVIDTAELEAAMASRGPMAGPGRERRQGQMGTRFIARFDQNADGKVTRDEYLVVVRERFRRADINNDGKITDDDLPPMARGQGLLSGRAAEAGPMMKRGRGQGRMLGWLRGADQNGDGQITLAEVETAALKRFDAVDRNHDGLVDATDFEALAKENVAYRVQRFLHLYGAERDGRVTREQFMKVGHERTAERRRMSANQNDSGRQGMRPRP